MLLSNARGPALPRRSIHLLALLPLAAACTLSGLDGLTTGHAAAPDGGNLEGGVDLAAASDAAASYDASIDGSTFDATLGVDSAAPNPPTFCVAGAHTFCFDFEDGKSFDDDLLFNENDNNLGTIDLSTDRATSGTHSAKIHVPRRGRTAGNSTTQLYHNQTSPWSKTHVEVSFFVVPPQWHDGDQSVPIFGHVFYCDQGSFDAYGFFGNGASSMGDGDTVQINGPAIPAGQWIRAILDFDPAGTVSGTMNGVTYGPQPFDPSALTPTSGIGQGAGIGIYGYASPTPDMTVYFDDFTIDW